MTSTISTKGQIVIPKRFREIDGIEAAEDFQVTRLGPGKYLYERVPKAPRTAARLVVDKDGLPLFRVPKGAPRLSTEEIKRLENELR
jgi:bifunctional DNA-binding transcriptional regulator/antitoxin component of YhaV-PrlF toxin-antitoxin module